METRTIIEMLSIGAVALDVYVFTSTRNIIHSYLVEKHKPNIVAGGPSGRPIDDEWMACQNF